jgi:hypothetical protein
MKEQNRDDFYEGPPLDDDPGAREGAAIADEAVRPGERQPLDRPLTDLEIPEGGVYPPQDVIERPHSATVGLSQNELTRDPSLSRAVDRADDGLSPEQAGYDRTIEGGSPGPLEPEAEQQPADSPDAPGGQWGSSG